MSEQSEFEESFGPLEAGIRAGFGRAPRGSVLACLEERTGSVLRLTLPDAGEDRDPVVKPTGPEKAASMGPRYQVLGEIARGGLGVVMKSRDLDLGRDVAVKVLHERFKDDRRLIERFVEEAQIGGQLQHPGIVPVYELGLQSDDRPFFAMKLVKGETLAAMLKKRRSPREDLQRFLRVFLQICQTVAYAHVRRVVHRDLKPSNILVGAFGEVQVVDWGLAKVLRGGGLDDEAERSREVSVIETVRTAEGSSQSLAGSIMGTPGYMSPEQARGDVERMDARSDVFSLGALLCEILSGTPPYDTDDRAAAVRDACECRYEPALRRLASSGAEHEIIELTRACLAPTREGRPQDAGEVATRVDAYLQSVEDRGRRAEVRAAELRVRARFAVALSSLVVVALLASGWVYLAWKGQRNELRAQTAQRANAALVEANRFVGQAQQAGFAGVDLWGSALVAARRAAEIVATGEAEAELHEQVASLLRTVEEREAATRQDALREEGHALWLDRVLEARIGPDVPQIDLFEGEARRRRESTRRRQEYAALFSELGHDTAATLEEASRQLDCAHRTRFAIAFDAWAEAERIAALGADQEGDPEAWRQPVRVARRLDPEDPWRNALRDEIGRDALDAAALRELARPEALRDRTAEEIAILVALLDAAGDGPGAVEAQIAGIVLHPGDFWLSVSLGNLCAQEELLGRINGKGVEWATRSAVVLRPESRNARFGLAMNSMALGDPAPDEILRELRRELPDDPVLQAAQFMLLMGTGRFDEGLGMVPAHVTALQRMQLDWDYAPLLWSHGLGEVLFDTPGISPERRGLLHVYYGRFDEAWAALEAHGPLRPGWPWLYLPAALDGVGSAEELRASIERLQRLASAGEATMASAPTTDLLAATELVAAGWDGLEQIVTLFEHAFVNDPASKEIWNGARARQIAAFAAALASGVGTEDGEALPPERRAALRRLALDWMHEELDVIERDLSSSKASREMARNYSRVFNQMNIGGWLAPIREPQYLARMEPDEARECRVLWARVHGLETMLVALFSE